MKKIDTEVSLFPHIKEADNHKNLPVEKILEAMRSEKWKPQVEKVRECKKALDLDPDDKEAERKWRAAKAVLPYFTASGTFTRRDNESLVDHSGLIQLDLDGKDNPTWSFEDMRDTVENDPYTFNAARSPSGDGVKGLIRISSDPEKHDASFLAMQDYYKNTYGLTIDKQCRDVSRAFFVTYDPDMFTRDYDQTQELQPTELELHALPAQEIAIRDVAPVRPLNDAIEALREIRNASGRPNYDTWLKLLSGMFNSYGQAGYNAVRDIIGGDGYDDKPPRVLTKRHTAGTVFHMAKELAEQQIDENFPVPMCGGEMQIDYSDDPIEVIRGVAARGEKLQIAGSSKAGKTWALLHLAGAIQTGGSFLGMECEQGNVLFLNFELSPVRMRQRIDAIPTLRDVTFLNFRGIQCHWPMVKRGLERIGGDYSTIMLDPIYKMLGDADENNNGDIAKLLHHVEEVASARDAMTAYSHHFSKGNKAGVDQIDRQSGAGSWGRDPDALVTLTPHTEDGCLVLEHTLRNYAKPESSVWKFDFPKFVHQPDENPESLKKSHGGSNKMGTWKDALHGVQCHPEGISRSDLVKHIITKTKASDSTARRYINDAVEQQKIFDDGGVFHTRQQDPQQDALRGDNLKEAI